MSLALYSPHLSEESERENFLLKANGKART